MMEESKKLTDGDENATQADHSHKPSSCNISSKLPSLKTLASVSVGLNVTVLLILVPTTLVLQSRIEKQQARICESLPIMPSGHDVMGPSDVTGRYDDVRRYCFKGEREECAERGYAWKTVEGEGGEKTHLCCGNLRDHMYGVMGEKVSEKLRLDFYRTQNLQTVKEYIAKLDNDAQVATYRPAAHVGILPNGDLTGPDDQAPRIQWDDSGEDAFLTGGVKNDGDRLTITHSGYYYVYSGLQFNVNPSEDYYKPIVAFLYRTVNGTRASRQKLMASRESSCRLTRGDAPGPVSMHMAGIFLLRQHDEISVRTGSQSLLERSPTTTYLGLHMV